MRISYHLHLYLELREWTASVALQGWPRKSVVSSVRSQEKARNWRLYTTPEKATVKIQGCLEVLRLSPWNVRGKIIKAKFARLLWRLRRKILSFLLIIEKAHCFSTMRHLLVKNTQDAFPSQRYAAWCVSLKSVVARIAFQFIHFKKYALNM